LDSKPQIGDGRYQLTEFVTKGGMGAIYRAHDVQLGRPVAIKCLLDVTQPEGKERAIREARILASLSHPNIMSVYDILSNNDQVWIVSEWLEGKSLAKLPLPLSPTFSLAIMSQVYSALAAAHDANIIHRDIKPQNVMISNEGKVSLIDFGVAYHEGFSTGETMVGSLRYTDPRILEGGHPDTNSDLFSAALLQIELMKGEKVLPDLAPIPLYRDMKRNFSSRLDRALEGIYPPVETMLRDFADINRENSEKSANDARIASQKCADILHLITQKTPEDFIKAQVSEKFDPDLLCKHSLLRQTDGMIESPKTPAKEKASWIAFKETLTTSKATELERLVFEPEFKKSRKTPITLYLTVLAAAATVVLIYTKLSIQQNGSNHTAAIENLNSSVKILGEENNSQIDSEKINQKPLTSSDIIGDALTSNQAADIGQIIKTANDILVISDEAELPVIEAGELITAKETTPSPNTAKTENTAIVHKIAAPRKIIESVKKMSVELPKGNIDRINNDDLFYGKIKLFITANSPATVFISGVEVGDLPRSEPFYLEPGKYLVRLENPYTHPLEKEVEIVDKPKKYRFKMVGKIIERTLVLSSSGQLFVNGIDHGQVTDIKLSLSYGIHEIWIKRGNRIIKPRNLVIEPESPERIILEVGGVH
jgi:serine/threonine protein kinase